MVVQNVGMSGRFDLEGSKSINMFSIKCNCWDEFMGDIASSIVVVIGVK